MKKALDTPDLYTPTTQNSKKYPSFGFKTTKSGVSAEHQIATSLLKRAS